MGDFSRRMFLGVAALGKGVVSGQEKGATKGPSPATYKSWQPKLGILANFSEANVRFAKNQGFASIGLFAHYQTTLDLSSPLPPQRIDQVKRSLKESGLHLSVIGCHQPNHIADDSAQRARSNTYFLRAIELRERGEPGAPL